MNMNIHFLDGVPGTRKISEDHPCDDTRYFAMVALKAEKSSVQRSVTGVTGDDILRMMEETGKSNLRYG